MPHIFHVSYSISFGLYRVSPCVRVEDAIRSTHNNFSLYALVNPSQKARPASEERQIHGIQLPVRRSQKKLTEIVTTMHFEYP